ncbi:MAG: twin-arginine translocase TatA/TatE family subunit [Acidimicrobiia bacterium]
MFSFSPSELLTIGLVALIVFGPRRLPEIARRAGQIVSYLRSAADEIRSELGDDVESIAKPFREAATDLSAAGKELIETTEGEVKWIDEVASDLSDVGEKPQPAEDGSDTGSETGSETGESL